MYGMALQVPKQVHLVAGELWGNSFLRTLGHSCQFGAPDSFLLRLTGTCRRKQAWFLFWLLFPSDEIAGGQLPESLSRRSSLKAATEVRSSSVTNPASH